MKNISDRNCRENQNTFYFQQLYPDYCAFYGIMCKNIVEPDRLQMTI